MICPQTRAQALAILGALTGFSALGCATQIDPYTADADSGSVHASITIERSTPAAGSGVVRGSALAGFVRVPAGLESKEVMRLVGLTVDYPAIGQCRSSSSVHDAAPAPLSYAEFINAGDIRLQTHDGATQLSPRAFPTITDLISGVVYTTRDRSADTLPAGARYTISASGNGTVPALVLDTDAPRAVENVAVGGVPLAELESVSNVQPLDMTWSSGDPADTLVVELSAGDGSESAFCSFRDDAGAGTVPAGIVANSGPGRLAVHRIRTRQFVKAGIDEGELRFDFAVRATPSFVR